MGEYTHNSYEFYHSIVFDQRGTFLPLTLTAKSLSNKSKGCKKWHWLATTPLVLFSYF